TSTLISQNQRSFFLLQMETNAETHSQRERERFNNINFFLTMYCIVVLSQGLIFGLTNLTIGHFEKEFYLSRAEKVVLSSAYDFTSLLVAIPVAYYGSRWNRPKWVAGAAFVVGLGSILCAIPYMKYQIISSFEEGEELCIEEEDRTVIECGESMVPHRSEILSLFVLGQCLQGIAGMPMYILGVTFLYDHTATHSSGIYIGISELVQVLGYGLGYTVGSPNLKAPNNQALKEVGTHNFLKQQVIWWASFLLATLLSWIAFLPLLCFPSYLPGARKLRLQKEKEPLAFDKKFRYKKFGPRLKDLLRALQCLFRSPMLICHAMCKATESLTSIGASEFLPKYLENQFLLTPSLATLLTVNFTEVAENTFTSTSDLISGFLYLDEYYTAEKNIDIMKFAGKWMELENVILSETYYSCSCIKEGLTTTDTQGDFIDAIPGKCNTKCFKLPLFFAFFFSSIVFSASAAIPITLIILQSLPLNLNSLGMGVTYTTLRFFGLETCEDLRSKDSTLSFEDFIRFVLGYNSEEKI
ncbi:hypothetical protein STEG23_022684, partial [Scotinomys teguina]